MPALAPWLAKLSTVSRSLRHRNYRLYFTSQIISISGTWMQTVAQSWLVYRLTGSTTLLGVVSFASQFPVFLLAPPAGILADRVNRHRVLVWTQVIAMLLAFVLAALTLGGVIEVPTVDGGRARVTVPEGTQTGHQFRLKGKGMSVMRSATRGDMYIRAQVETPVKLSKRQKELLHEFEKESPSARTSPESEGFFARVKDAFNGFAEGKD